MPIRRYLHGERFDAETLRAMGGAFEGARATLRGEQWGDGADTIIARHIIALALGGERDADRLCDYALAKLREADGPSSQSASDAHAAALKPGPRT